MITHDKNNRLKHFRAIIIVGLILITNAYTNAYAATQSIKSVKIPTSGTQITFTDDSGYWLEYGTNEELII